MTEATLARAESALSEGDTETALDLLATYAELRSSGEGGACGDQRWEYLTELAMQMMYL